MTIKPNSMNKVNIGFSSNTNPLPNRNMSKMKYDCINYISNNTNRICNGSPKKESYRKKGRHY